MKEFSLLVIFILIGTCKASCPPDWTQFENNCFTLDREYSTWIEAFGRCQAHQAYLASPKTLDVNAFLKAFLEAHNQTSYVWIGGSDELKADVWTWTVTDEPFTYTDWGDGQPDNYHGNEHCVLMYRRGKHQYHWGDANCETKSALLCEKPADLSGPYIHKLSPRVQCFVSATCEFLVFDGVLTTCCKHWWLSMQCSARIPIFSWNNWDKWSKVPCLKGQHSTGWT